MREHISIWEYLGFMVYLNTAESCPRPQVQGLVPRSPEAEPRTKVTQKLTWPLCYHCQKPLITTNKFFDSILGKGAHSSKHPIAPQPITYCQQFQQELSLSCGYKNWLLTKTVNSPWPVRNCALEVPTLSLLFVLNKLTLFCSSLCLEILFQPTLRLPQQTLNHNSPFSSVKSYAGVGMSPSDHRSGAQAGQNPPPNLRKYLHALPPHRQTNSEVYKTVIHKTHFLSVSTIYQ